MDVPNRCGDSWEGRSNRAIEALAAAAVASRRGHKTVAKAKNQKEGEKTSGNAPFEAAEPDVLFSPIPPSFRGVGLRLCLG